MWRGINGMKPVLVEGKEELRGGRLDDKSYVTAERNKPSIKIDSEDLLTLSNQLINYSENILQTPKKELREN